VGALSTDRETATMADPLVAADLDLALDVLLDFTSQVTLDVVGSFDVPRRIRATSSSVSDRILVSGSMSVSAQTWRAGSADPVDVGQPDLEPLVPWEVYSCNSCHLVVPHP
jgi:hypothetical protein